MVRAADLFTWIVATAKNCGCCIKLTSAFQLVATINIYLVLLASSHSTTYLLSSKKSMTHFTVRYVPLTNNHSRHFILNLPNDHGKQISVCSTPFKLSGHAHIFCPCGVKCIFRIRARASHSSCVKTDHFQQVDLDPDGWKVHHNNHHNHVIPWSWPHGLD